MDADEIPAILLGLLIVGVFLLILHFTIGDIVAYKGGVWPVILLWLGSGIGLGKILTDYID